MSKSRSFIKRPLKTESLTMRMSVKEKRKLELAAKSQGRTITMVILRALEETYDRESWLNEGK